MHDPDTAPFRFTVRVYWEDTDAGGIVFYANYLKFFERARTEWLRALGLAQEELRTAGGLLFMVSAASLRYLAPARLDDAIDVTVRPRSAGRATLELGQEAWRREPSGPAKLLADATVRIACVDAGTYRPRRIPTSLLQAFADARPTHAHG
ncbi:MAG: tol-pal system-associated acyl-CoA thioesterase [Proteobacteria bacterium]|nr:tol-pal system-associated acyl-CoA thioesterase [Pseudomonadota bacterium]